MNKLLIGSIICALLLLHSSSTCAEDFFDGKVDTVLDGGTIILRGGTIVQYMGIDVPQLRGGNPSFKDVAEVAFNYNKKLVEKKTIRLEIVQPTTVAESDSRKFAYVFCGGQMINSLLLKKGYAVISTTVPPDEKYKDYFTRSQNVAVQNNLGLWRKLSSALSKLKGSSQSHAFK